MLTFVDELNGLRFLNVTIATKSGVKFSPPNESNTAISFNSSFLNDFKFDVRFPNVISLKINF